MTEVKDRAGEKGLCVGEGDAPKTPEQPPCRISAQCRMREWRYCRNCAHYELPKRAA